MRTPLALACICAALSANAADTTVADLLFKDQPLAAALPVSERNAIAALFPLMVRDGKLRDNFTGCNEESYTRVEFIDLNTDGQSEIVVTEGNACIYGMRGGLNHFLVKSAQGQWREVLSGTGDVIAYPSYEIHKAEAGQWPAIMPGTRGLCLPIYQYSAGAQRYVLTAKTPDPKYPNACEGK